MLTIEQLKHICPTQKQSRLNLFIPYLNKYIEEYKINTPLRIQHFISQLAHESGSFTYVKELASGKAYEGRKDLGNIEPGDGIKFKGRGLIQITGRNNYKSLSNFIFKDDRLLKNPEILEQPEYAVLSAVWFWNIHNLNDIADLDNIKKITKVINGGYNGLDDRSKFLQRAKEIIK